MKIRNIKIELVWKGIIIKKREKKKRNFKVNSQKDTNTNLD